MLLETNSGFERRAFGIAFTLALAEITKRRVPLVIDTPLGNADSEYRPRTLKALADFDLDQIIILTHDKEVTPDLVEHIRGQILPSPWHRLHLEHKKRTSRAKGSLESWLCPLPLAFASTHSSLVAFLRPRWSSYDSKQTRRD